MSVGFLFRSSRDRQRIPRTLAEVDVWLRARAAAEVWLDEQHASIGTDRDGKLIVKVGRRKLAHYERVQIWHDGQWVVGTLRLSGDGGRSLANPRVTLAYRRTLPLSLASRLRVLKL